MTKIKKILENNLFHNGEFTHHAFILNGEQNNNYNVLLDLLQDENILAPKQTNLIYLEIDKILLENAKFIREKVSLKTVKKFKKIFVLKFSKINREAENALLKTFEEPPKETVFFLITQNYHLLLPTTISRFQVIDLKINKSDLNENANHRKSKKSDSVGIKNDLLEIEKLIKKFKDKDVSILELNDFLIKFEKIIRRECLKKNNMHYLKKIAKLREYLFDPSPNTKMILEMAIILKDSILQQ